MKIPKTKKAYGPAVKRAVKTVPVDGLYIPTHDWMRMKLQCVLDDWNGYLLRENIEEIEHIVASAKIFSK